MVAYAEPGDGGQEGGDATAVERAGGGGGSGGGHGRGVGRTGPGGLEMSTSIPIIRRLRLYPAALVVCWFWATVNRVREAFMPYGASMFWLFVLQYGFQVCLGVSCLDRPSFLECVLLFF